MQRMQSKNLKSKKRNINRLQKFQNVKRSISKRKAKQKVTNLLKKRNYSRKNEWITALK